jgi:hypothetical protein
MTNPRPKGKARDHVAERVAHVRSVDCTDDGEERNDADSVGRDEPEGIRQRPDDEPLVATVLTHDAAVLKRRGSPEAT